MSETSFFHTTFGVMTVIIMIPVFFMWLEKITKWRIFKVLPPIVWIFATPILLSNLNIIPKSSEIYSTFKSFAVPLFIVFMLLDINIRESLKVAGRSIGVLIMGSIGVVVGAVVSFFLFKQALMPDAWSAYGALAGSWIGGSGNLAAVADSLNVSPQSLGIIILVDNVVVLAYFPLILTCKRWAPWFNRFTRVTQEQIDHIKNVEGEIEEKCHEIHFKNVLTLFAFGFAALLVATWIGDLLPELKPVFTAKTWAMLMVTTIGIIFSMTPLKKVPGTKPFSLALVYIYMTMMGAMADLDNIDKAHWFILAGFICLAIHLLFITISARIFRVDVSLAAVASIAAMGGAASAPVVAAYHREELVPVSIMLALIGYALGNYLGVATAYLCNYVM